MMPATRLVGVPKAPRSQIAVKPQERRGDEMVLFIIYSRWAAAGRGMVEWNGLND
jgi:hypothetical protein